MPKGGSKLRTIVEQPIVTASLKKAKLEYPRIDELFDSFKWILARNPSHGATLVKDGETLLGLVRRNVPNKIQRKPSMTVVYKVNDNEVIVEAITIREE